jgi:hypothetical protein
MFRDDNYKGYREQIPMSQRGKELAHSLIRDPKNKVISHWCHSRLQVKVKPIKLNFSEAQKDLLIFSNSSYG